MTDLSLHIAALPCDDAAPPKVAFLRERQVRFLEGLSVWGNVRAACRNAGCSPQSAYRLRRSCREFAIAWDAALLAARPNVEGVLADRALNGVEEQVFYHGEEVARRRRYDARLLLAHLGRLDRMCAHNSAAREASADFDAVLECFAREGRVTPEPRYSQFSDRFGDIYADDDGGDWEDDGEDDGDDWEEEMEGEEG